MMGWRYRYNCRFCDECFPYGAESSDDAYDTRDEAMKAAEEHLGDMQAFTWWAVEELS